MESNQNENGLMEWNKEDEILNDRFQTEQNITQEIIDSNERNEMKGTFKHLTFKEKYGESIIGMQFIEFTNQDPLESKPA
jgi:hypothetical protein